MPRPPHYRPDAPSPATQSPRIVYIERHDRRVQTIERTSKIWKLLQLIGAVGIITGIAVLFIMPAGSSLQASGFLMIIAGFLTYIIARVAAWWCHG